MINTKQNLVRFDDIEGIESRSTGDLWGEWGRARLITHDEIRIFSDLTDNHQWIHEDVDRCARESPYGDLIVHGLFLVCLVPGLLPFEGCEIVGYSVRIVRGIDTLRLPSPVYPDQSVHVRARRLSAHKATSGKGTVVRRDIELWSFAGSKPAMTGTLKLQYY